jgi:hypothetical protein
MKHPSTRDVFDYWNQRRGERLAPERAEIDPGEIRRALGDTFILSFDSVAGAQFRLAGTRLCALACRELKGEAFIDLWAEAERASVSEHIDFVMDESSGIVAGVTGRNQDGSLIDLEMLLLPLGRSDRKYTRLLGVLAPCTTPYWMGNTAMGNLGLGTIRHLGPAASTVEAPRLVPSEEHRARHGFLVYDGGRS